jgi:hypothetical protein
MCKRTLAPKRMRFATEIEDVVSETPRLDGETVEPTWYNDHDYYQFKLYSRCTCPRKTRQKSTTRAIHYWASNTCARSSMHALIAADTIWNESWRCNANHDTQCGDTVSSFESHWVSHIVQLSPEGQRGLLLSPPTFSEQYTKFLTEQFSIFHCRTELELYRAHNFHVSSC